LPSWVTWQELAALNWEEEASNPTSLSMLQEDADQQTGIKSGNPRVQITCT
jgi:hypothetical protein